jgi:hypothetical protein
MPPRGIRTRNPTKQAAADLRLMDRHISRITSRVSLQFQRYLDVRCCSAGTYRTALRHILQQYYLNAAVSLKHAFLFPGTITVILRRSSYQSVNVAFW